MRHLLGPLPSLLRHRDLVVQFTQRELRLRHRGSRLGHFWALLSPMTMLALYLFVFGFIMGGTFREGVGETRFDYALSLFLGLCLFHVVSETMAAGPNLIVAQPNFVKKVVFPLEIIPFSNVATSLYHALLSIFLLLAIAPFSHYGVSWTGALALPVLLLPLALIALGLAWGLAALGVYVRDIAHLAPFLSTALMFSSGVFYAPKKIPPEIWSFLQYNPLLLIVDEARRLLLWQLPLDFGALAYIYAFALFSVALGYTLFALLRPYFAEVI